MVGAETSYMTGGNFLDMEKSTSRQHHLKARCFSVCLMPVKVRKTGSISGLQLMRGGRKQLAEVSLSAHMKSFSWVYRRLFVVMGSLE
jgi:hypothetical protein